MQAAGTAYDSLNEVCSNDDNGCTQDGYKLTKAFTAAIPYSAVLCGSDFSKYKYHTMNVTYNGASHEFQVWDCCNNADCGGCCTSNANKFGGFLLDMSIVALRKYKMESSNCDDWGIKKIEIEDRGTFDHVAVANQFGLKQNC